MISTGYGFGNLKPVSQLLVKVKRVSPLSVIQSHFQMDKAFSLDVIRVFGAVDS